MYPEAWRLYYPDDIDTAYGLTWRRGASASIGLSVAELLLSLQSTCDEAAKKKLNLCFFIDGLDEYDGRPRDLIDLISRLWKRANVKLCLSSREWNEFKEEYGKKGPQGPRMLLMQDHNRPDIHRYIQEKLQGNQRYGDLEDDNNGRDGFVNEVTEAAQGVFLWVYLVMMSFDEGLKNGKFDSIDDLKETLDKLPKDLDDYFRRIIERDIADENHEEAARILSIAAVSVYPLPFMVYWFANQARKNPEYAFELAADPISPQKLAGRRERMDQRLKACCKGLLEIQYEPLRKDAETLPCSALYSHKVDFFHRTVRDFLQLGETKKILRGWLPTPYDPNEEICKSLLAQFKITPRNHEYWAEFGPVDRPCGLLRYHFTFLEVGTTELYTSSRIARLSRSVALVLYQRGYRGRKYNFWNDLASSQIPAKTLGGSNNTWSRLQKWLRDKMQKGRRA